jgi:hypothetical protein
MAFLGPNASDAGIVRRLVLSKSLEHNRNDSNSFGFSVYTPFITGLSRKKTTAEGTQSVFWEEIKEDKRDAPSEGATLRFSEVGL